MIHWQRMCAAMIVLTLTACTSSPPPKPGSHEPPTKGLPEVLDSVYLPVDGATPPPDGYGLYTVLLTRTVNPNTTRVLSGLFATIGPAGDAAIERVNLNLITIPVKNAAQAEETLASARSEADAAATALMQKHYDFNLAALLMSSVCRPARGAAVMNACGSAPPDGPLLVTSEHALGGSIPAGEKLLIVNLSTTPTRAIAEVLAAYREQILREKFDDGKALSSWRLRALNYILEAANLLPEIRKAYAGLISP